MAGTNEGVEARARRRRAAAKWQPKRIRLLLIAEAPPSSLDRYFYFEDVASHDWLFRYVCKGLFGITPTRDQKPLFLSKLRGHGVFLIDLNPEPIVDVVPKEHWARLVCNLIPQCRELRPERIILIKASVHDLAYEPLAAAGLPVSAARIPFPASGQQKQFEIGFAAALDEYNL